MKCIYAVEKPEILYDMLLMTRNSTQCSILFIGRNMRQLTKKNRDGPTGRGIALSMCTLFIDA